MRLLRDLWATSPGRTTAVAGLIVFSAAGQAVAAALAGPVLVHRSAGLFAVLTAALVVAVIGDLVMGLVTARLTADWTADVRRRLCQVAFGQDLPTLDGTPAGELLDRIDGDVYQVGAELRGNGVRIVRATAVGVLSIVTAVFVWWPAGSAMMLLAVVLVAGLWRRTQQISGARMREEEAWSDLAAVMEESIHGQDDIRTSLARPYVLLLLARRTREVLAYGRVVWRLSARVTTIASGSTRAAIALVAIGGVWALTTGRIDGARLTGIWLLSLAFGLTVEYIGRAVPHLQNAFGAWSRVQLLAAAPQEPAGGAAPPDGDLEIRGLTFQYDTDGPAADRGSALRDVHLTFVRGRSYALIGRTGSGKSTLAKVLTRAVDVPRGAVFLGGTDVLDLDVEALRRWVAIVPQRTEILAGTLAENIALFDPELMGAATHALAELGLTRWVASLPDGLQTRLGEGGSTLSAGQEQLVAFARILVRDPHVVILDEATARMDPVTEGWVQRATERLLANRIGIIIAHRLSSVRRCDDVVVIADGAVIDAGPMRESRHFAQLLAAGNAAMPAELSSAAVPAESGHAAMPAAAAGREVAGREVAGREVAAGHEAAGGIALAEPDAPAPPVPAPGRAAGADLGHRPAESAKVKPPPLPAMPPVRTMRQICRLAVNDARFGLSSVGMFLVLILFGLDGLVLPWLWADLIDGAGSPYWPALGITAGLMLGVPLLYSTQARFPEWWVRQMLRISTRLVHGQTGPRRVSPHTPAEVVAQGGDTDRVVQLADNVMDQFLCAMILAAMVWVSGSITPSLFFGGTMLASGLMAALFGPALERAARKTVAGRAAFSTALVSSLSAARTVKLAGATRSVLGHLANLDEVRSERQRREIVLQVWARSTPSLLSGLLPVAAWAMYLVGDLSAGATLVAVSTLGAANWFAWTAASLVSQLPSARVWTARTVAMAGTGDYTAEVPGVDISAGTAPAPATAPRHPLRTLELRGFSAVHEDGTVGVRDVDLNVLPGELVLIVGPVGAGKSSLLRALAGIVHHTGSLHWNSEPVTEPELFLRPNQVGYVAQLPRVLSGTVAENIRLGHEVDAAAAVSTAQLDHDLATGGLGLLIGHKGTRLSGGQLQRLALARALAPRTELLIADDVSSALDVTTELDLWRALREHGITVVGSTSKRAALARADRVVVLIGGAVVAQGTWNDLAERWGHLAG